MMRFLVARAVNPQLSLLDGLRDWNGIAAATARAAAQAQTVSGRRLGSIFILALMGGTPIPGDLVEFGLGRDRRPICGRDRELS